ncbi:MAG: hypothetical protein ACMXYK_01490 [Candidatus Woesearchaeota archaeon]
MNTKDTLSEKELRQFYKLKHSLYIFANKKINVLKHTNNWKDVEKNTSEEIMKIRNHIFLKEISIIDEYVQLNPNNLIEEELEILLNWKKAIICKKAILFKHTNEHSLFLVKNNVYAITGLMDSFKEIFDNYTPVLIDLIILPFKNKLVHEGLFMPYNISFGKSIRDSMNAEGEELILKKGIITSLDNENHQNKVSDEDLLRFYMKSESNQDRFFEKIDELKNKSKELKSIYNYEIGRINSRHIKKQLKNQDIKGHFAILYSQVIASGSTKKELEINLRRIISKEREKEVYFIKI